jgi:GT2 family glycosyltransferase
MQAVCPKVAIVILNWNGLQDTLECLESLKTIVYPNCVIVVIDNGSKGNDAEIIKEKFGDFVFVIEEETNLGFTGGCNVGIRWALHSGAKYVLLLNNDVVVDVNFLTELVNVAQNDVQIGIVGPKAYYYDQPKKIAYAGGGNVNFWTGNVSFIGKNATDDGRFDNIAEVDFVGGSALLIKEETIKRIGLLNEMYFAYYEETEWCTKARKAGFKVVYVPKARIWDKGPKRRKSELAMYYMTRNRFLFVKRNSSSFQLIIFNIFFLTTDLLGQMKNKLFLRPKFFIAYLKGIRDGLGTYSCHK